MRDSLRPGPVGRLRPGAGQGENLCASRSKARTLNRGSTWWIREGSLGRISLGFLAPSREPSRTVIKFSLLLEGLVLGIALTFPSRASGKRRRDKRPLRKVLSYNPIFRGLFIAKTETAKPIGGFCVRHPLQAKEASNQTVATLQAHSQTGHQAPAKLHSSISRIPRDARPRRRQSSVPRRKLPSPGAAEEAGGKSQALRVLYVPGGSLVLPQS